MCTISEASEYKHIIFLMIVGDAKTVGSGRGVDYYNYHADTEELIRRRMRGDS